MTQDGWEGLSRNPHTDKRLHIHSALITSSFEAGPPHPSWLCGSPSLPLHENAASWYSSFVSNRVVMVGDEFSVTRQRLRPFETSHCDLHQFIRFPRVFGHGLRTRLDSHKFGTFCHLPPKKEKGQGKGSPRTLPTYYLRRFVVVNLKKKNMASLKLKQPATRIPRLSTDSNLLVKLASPSKTSQFPSLGWAVLPCSVKTAHPPPSWVSR